MPYTPPSTSPSSLHSVLPAKSSSVCAGLSNGNVPLSSFKQPPPPQASNNYHARSPNHHRRSSGPTSPSRAPIPVAAFAKDHSSSTRSSSVRRTSCSSTSDSDGEDNKPSLHVRHNRDIQNLKELLREQLPQRKTLSPPGSPVQRYISNAVVSRVDNLPPLDTDVVGYDLTASDGEHSSSTTPPDDGIDFPRMVRKKSGEVVKPTLKAAHLRPRPLSLPSTPVCPKAVHFDAQLEHIRLFLHSEKPLAISTNTSPSGEYSDPIDKEYAERMSEKQYQITLPNFPKDDQLSRRDLPVRVKSVDMASSGKNLVGTVLVKNIAFHKWVMVRFTFDHWQTISEVTATYDSPQGNGDITVDSDWDRFTFSIKLVEYTNLEARQMLFCVRYNVAGQEFWDNNYGLNYQVEFSKRPTYMLRRPSRSPEVDGLSHASTDSAIGDDFDIEMSPETFAKTLKDQITSPRSVLLANLGESPPFVKNATRTSSPFVSSGIVNGKPQKLPTGKAFANRYDFEASLSAAIASANSAMGFDSGLQNTPSPKLNGAFDSYFPPLARLFSQSTSIRSPNELSKEDQLVNNIKNTHLSGLQQAHHFRSRSYPLGPTAQSQSWSVEDEKEGYNSDEAVEKPAMNSSSYNQFINNYCFFEPGKAEILRSAATVPKEVASSAPSLLGQPQFPNIRATVHSPPPSPRKLSPVRRRDESKPTRLSSHVEYSGSSDSNQSSSETSASSTPRSASPQLTRSPERSRDHSRDSSPSMHFHHHHSPLGCDTPAVQPTALVI